MAGPVAAGQFCTEVASTEDSNPGRYAEIPSLLDHQAASGSRPEDSALLNREIAASIAE